MIILKYDPNQPRDASGKWTDTGGNLVIAKPGFDERVAADKAWLGIDDDRYTEGTKILRQSSGDDYIILGEFIKKAWIYDDPETGLNTEVSRVIIDGDNLEVSLRVKDYKGNEFDDKYTEIIRSVRPDGEIHHDVFTLDEALQGTGFGARYYRNSEQAYMDAGFKKVTIYADINVGGYAWSRMGFDLDQSRFGRYDTMTALGRKFEADIYDKLTKNGMLHSDADAVIGRMPRNEGGEVEFNHTWEMATYKDPGGVQLPHSITTYHDKFGGVFSGKPTVDNILDYSYASTKYVKIDLGKAGMLGTRWNAYKMLDPNHITYQVGERYYAEKSKELVYKYDPNQPRDDHGRWSNTGAASIEERIAADREYGRTVGLNGKFYDNAKSILAAATGNPDILPGEFIKKAWNFEDTETGLHTQVGYVYPQGNTLKVGIDLIDYKGNAISATISRSISTDGVVNHKGFEIPERLQGLGFGGKFYRQSEDAYMEAGLKAIKIHANMTVGGYAWARMGFTQEYDISGIGYSLRLFAKAKGLDVSNYPEDFNFMHEVAVFKDPSGAKIPRTVYSYDKPSGKIDYETFNPSGQERIIQMDVGKAYLLGRSWNGIKILDKNDPGWIAGQKYYNSKKGERYYAERANKEIVYKYDPNQPRDSHGRWSDTGASVSAPSIPLSFLERLNADVDFCKSVGLSEYDYGEARLSGMSSTNDPEFLPGEFAKKAWEYTDTETGLNTKIQFMQHDTYDDSLKVEISLHDYTGKKFDNFDASITRSIHYAGEIHHDEFAMPQALQGTGFGSRFYQNSEQAYMNAGFKEVTIFANINIGGYAWARMGFDIDVGTMKNISNEFKRSVQDKMMYANFNTTVIKATVARIPEFNHMWELAAYKDTEGIQLPHNVRIYPKITGKVTVDGIKSIPEADETSVNMDLGKSFLLGYGWLAHKMLDTSHVTWQAGEKYYNSKKG